MITGIYKIEGPQGMVYIGQALNVPARWRAYLDALSRRKLKKTNPALQKDWDEFGPLVFTFSIIEICEDHELTGREAFWIKKQDPDKLYNGPDENAKHRHQGKVRLSDGQVFRSQWAFAVACGYANPNSVAIAVWRGETHDQIAKRRGLLK